MLTNQAKQSTKYLECSCGHSVPLGTYVCRHCGRTATAAVEQLLVLLEEKASTLVIPTNPSEILAMQVRELYIQRELLRRLYTDTHHFGAQHAGILKSIRTATNWWLFLVILGFIFAMLGLLGSCAGLLGLG